MAREEQFAEEGNITQNSQEKVQFVLKRFETSKSARTGEVSRFSRYYSLYRGRQSKKNYRGLSELFIPEPHRIVERKVAKIVNAMKSIHVTPEGEQDSEAARVGTILANYLQRKLNLKDFYRMWIKESRIVGASWARILWDVEKEEEAKPWLGYKIQMFPVDRVAFDPKATMWDVMYGKLEWLIFDYEATPEMLKRNKNYNQKLVNIAVKEHSDSEKSSTLAQVRQIFRSGESSGKSGGEGVEKKINIKEFWGIKDGKKVLMVVANGKWLLRDDPNPVAEIIDNIAPAVFLPSSIEPQEISPIGDIEPNESLFNELNDTRNQRMDTVTQNIDPIKIVQRSANIRDDELVQKRGWVVHSDTPTGVQFITPDMQGVIASINEEKIIRSDIQQSTGVIDFSTDGGTAAGLSIDTARGAVIAKGEADVVVEDKISIVKSSMKEFWRIMMAYAQKFLDREFTIRIVEAGAESFYNVSNEDIQGNIDIDVEIETLQDKTTRQQLALLLFNQAKDVPGAKIGKFFTDVLEVFKDDVVISEYFDENFQEAPAPPKVSVSLKGEIGKLQSDQVYKTIPGVDPTFGDPLMSPEGRQLMRGEMPEDLETLRAQTEILKQLEISGETPRGKAETDKVISETVKNLTDTNASNKS